MEIVYKLTSASLKQESETAFVIITVSGKTSTPGWTNFSLSKSAGGPKDLYENFDVQGNPPDGPTIDVISDFSFSSKVHRSRAKGVRLISTENEIVIDYP